MSAGNIVSESELAAMSPEEFRSMVRRGRWTSPTFVPCQRYMKANLAIVPKEFAFDFFLFCQRNSQPCPVIDVTDAGSPHPLLVAPNADVRTDVPRYNVYVNGELKVQPTDITDWWRDDLVAFLLGCSMGLDYLLRDANVCFRSLDAVYTTTIPCVEIGRFSGPMTVTCRLVKGTRDVVRTIQISSRNPATHGTPVHLGDPSVIGIKDLSQGDVFASPKLITRQEPDEIALFWGCGTTPGSVAIEARLPLMITHCPAHMFVTDRRVEELAIM